MDTVIARLQKLKAYAFIGSAYRVQMMLWLMGTWSMKEVDKQYWGLYVAEHGN